MSRRTARLLRPAAAMVVTAVATASLAGVWLALRPAPLGDRPMPDSAAEIDTVEQHDSPTAPLAPPDDEVGATDATLVPVATDAASTALVDVLRNPGGPVIEQLAPARVGRAPGAENQWGRPVLLDETGLLACAHTRHAAGLVAQGDGPAASLELARAAARAGRSATTALATRYDQILAAAAGSDVNPTIEVVTTVCADNGFLP